MEPIAVLALHCVMSLLVFALMAHWYVIPKINQRNKLDVLAVLLLINVFRYLPLSLYMPGQVSTEFPEIVRSVVAHGDFLAGVLALIAFVALKTKGSMGLTLAWVFSLVSIVDIISALSLAMFHKVYELDLGANYFTVVVYVPLLMIVQIAILKILFNKSIKA